MTNIHPKQLPRPADAHPNNDVSTATMNQQQQYLHHPISGTRITTTTMKTTKAVAGFVVVQNRHDEAKRRTTTTTGAAEAAETTSTGGVGGTPTTTMTNTIRRRRSSSSSRSSSTIVWNGGGPHHRSFVLFGTTSSTTQPSTAQQRRSYIRLSATRGGTMMNNHHRRRRSRSESPSLGDEEGTMITTSSSLSSSASSSSSSSTSSSSSVLLHQTTSDNSDEDTSRSEENDIDNNKKCSSSSGIVTSTTAGSGVVAIGQQGHGHLESIKIISFVLIGIFYSMLLLRHPSTTLTANSWTYMMLLSVQYAIQPTLSKMYLSTKSTTSISTSSNNNTNSNNNSLMITAAFYEELIKMMLSSIIFFGTKSKEYIQHSIQDWSIYTSFYVAGVPAILYAIQGVMQYVSHINLDPVTYNGLTQTKTISTAICCYLLLGQKPSAIQCIALVILFISAILFQQKKPTEAKSGISRNSALQNSLNDNDDWFMLGVVPCLFAAFLSGLAGALSQKGLQQQITTAMASSSNANGSSNRKDSGRDPFLYTIEISFFSAMALFVSRFIKWIIRISTTTSSRQRQQQQRHAAGNDNSSRQATTISATTTTKQPATTTMSSSLSASVVHQHCSWTWKMMLPIIVKAMGGILTALVHKYAGSVAKGFSLMLGLVLSAFIQMRYNTTTITTTDKNGNNHRGSSNNMLNNHQMIATILIMLSTWLHFTNPPSTIKTPPVPPSSFTKVV